MIVLSKIIKDRTYLPKLESFKITKKKSIFKYLRFSLDLSHCKLIDENGNIISQSLGYGATYFKWEKNEYIALLYFQLNNEDDFEKIKNKTLFLK